MYYKGMVMDQGTAEAITAWATAAGAIATAVMAFFTWRAIKNGQKDREKSDQHYAETREQEKRHHQDTFRPLVVLTPYDVMSILDRNKVLFPDPNGKTLKVDLIARNIGVGPALNIHLSVRSEGRRNFGPSRVLAPLAVGGGASNDRHYILIDVNVSENFNFADLSNVPNGHWIVVLEYQDVFGNWFHTLHSHQPDEPWTKADRGRAPDTPPPELNTVVQASPISFWSQGAAP